MDALCGPSNPLQNFQKHTAADRTLQQDRILSRQSPSQGFRSNNLNQGTLDAEFGAFESGVSGPPLADFDHPANSLQHGGPAPFAPNLHETSGWAADFEKLHVSGPSPSIPQQQILPEAQLQHTSGASGWQNEFLQRSQQPTPQSSSLHTPLRYSPAVGGMGYNGLSNFAPRTEAMGAYRHDETKQTETFDDTAFEAAFAEARAEVELEEKRLREEGEATIQPETTKHVKIGSDTIAPQVDGVDESDALAKTAGQLLDSVSHDHSQKFKESNFLALMRQLRDREVTVEGDEFRHKAQPLHPGGQFYPEQHRKPSASIDTSAGTATTATSTDRQNLRQTSVSDDLDELNERNQTRQINNHHPTLGGENYNYGDNNALYREIHVKGPSDRRIAYMSDSSLRQNVEESQGLA